MNGTLFVVVIEVGIVGAVGMLFGVSRSFRVTKFEFLTVFRS